MSATTTEKSTEVTEAPVNSKSYGSLRTSGIVKIRSVKSNIDPKRNLMLGKARFYVPKNADGAWVTNHTREELRTYDNLPVLVKDIHNKEVINDKFMETFFVVISPEGIDLDLSKERDRFAFQVLQHYKSQISDNVGRKTKDTRFYVMDEAKEAVGGNIKRKLVHLATEYLYKLTPSQQIDFCSLYGIPTSGLTPEQAEAKLGDKIDKNPQTFIDRFEKTVNTENEIFLNLLVEYRILRKDGAIYYYEGEMLGSNPDEAIGNLNKPELANRKAMLKTQLNNVRQVKG